MSFRVLFREPEARELARLPAPPAGRRGWPWTVESPPVPDRMPDGGRWPRITVVTPSYNQGRFLEATLRSVLLQGYPELEYLVMDGGSTDGTVELLERYGPFIDGWASEPDGGQSSAINKGWRRATGRIVAWLNSDDIYFPGALAGAARALREQPGAGGVYGDIRYIDADGAELHTRRPGQLDCRDLLNALVSLVPQPTTFVRREVLDAVGVLNEDLHYSMDYDLWLRVSARFPLLYVGETWAATRLHEDAKTVAHHVDVWRGKHRVIEPILGLPELATIPAREKAGIRAACHYRAACAEAGHGELARAAQSLLASFRERPAVPLAPARLLRLLRLLGRRAVRGGSRGFWPGASNR